MRAQVWLDTGTVKALQSPWEDNGLLIVNPSSAHPQESDGTWASQGKTFLLQALKAQSGS